MPEHKTSSIEEQLRSLEAFKENLGQSISSQELEECNRKIGELLNEQSSSVTSNVVIPPQEDKKS
jgi:hypothetical protein